MKDGDDPGICVAIERKAHGQAGLLEVDGECVVASAERIEDLIRRERLHVVARSELRALTARYPHTINWNALRENRDGAADAKAWRRVARLQERHRSHADGWDWWYRFTQCNTATICSSLLTLLNGIADEHPDLRYEGMPMDWMSLLREAVAGTNSGTAGEIRTWLHERIREIEEE